MRFHLPEIFFFFGGGEMSTQTTVIVFGLFCGGGTGGMVTALKPLLLLLGYQDIVSYTHDVHLVDTAGAALPSLVELLIA